MREIVIRPAVPLTDFEQLAGLLSLVEPEPVTAEMLHEWERRDPPGQIRHRLVAHNPAGDLIGYGLVMHYSWAAADHFHVWQVTDLEWRGRGIGRQMWDRVLSLARDCGAQRLTSEVSDIDGDSLAFAERRNFTIERHLFESAIDLDSFDERPLAGLVTEVEAQGIRFFSLADTPDYASALRKLHALNYQLALDDPASEGGFPDFEAFSKIVDGAEWFVPAGQFLAADGERYVGLAAVGPIAGTEAMRNLITGVDRDYRGRKIAQALKLLSIRFARAAGARAIVTKNDSENGPMLAINRKLGYRPRPGVYRLARKRVQTNV